jgi:prolyl oligopeptidase
MLRFHRYTIGHAWTSDYGNPDIKEDFEVLLKYSPLHNVKKQVYPSYMITTSDHDDRVVPHHSLKLLVTIVLKQGNFAKHKSG